jgi:hypothetical protein
MPSDTPVRHISHDAFARTSLVRRIVWVHSFSRSCSWCGGHKFTPAGNMFLYQYGTEHDDNSRTDWHEGRFCSKDCHDTYHMI